jgi:phage shock protein E
MIGVTMLRISRCLFPGVLAIGASWGVLCGGGPGVPAVPAASPGDPKPALPAQVPAKVVAKAEPVRHVEPAEARKLLKENPKVVILDVRTPREFVGGHLEKARNLDFQGKDFARQLEQLDRDKTYLVHCAAGGRSTKSLEVFQQLGFKSVVHLDGGLNAWTKAGLPLAKE